MLNKILSDSAFKEMSPEQAKAIIGGATFYVEVSNTYFKVEDVNLQDLLGWMAGGAIAGSQGGLLGAFLGAAGGAVGVIGASGVVTQVSRSDLPTVSVSFGASGANVIIPIF